MSSALGVLGVLAAGVAGLALGVKAGRSTGVKVPGGIGFGKSFETSRALLKSSRLIASSRSAFNFCCSLFNLTSCFSVKYFLILVSTSVKYLFASS